MRRSRRKGQLRRDVLRSRRGRTRRPGPLRRRRDASASTRPNGSRDERRCPRTRARRPLGPSWPTRFTAATKTPLAMACERCIGLPGVVLRRAVLGLLARDASRWRSGRRGRRRRRAPSAAPPPGYHWSQQTSVPMRPDARVERAEAEIAGREVELLVVERDRPGCASCGRGRRMRAVGVEDDGGVVVDARRRAARRARRRSTTPSSARELRRGARWSGPGSARPDRSSAASSRWQKYGERNSSCRQTICGAAAGGLADARDGRVEVRGRVGAARASARGRCESATGVGHRARHCRPDAPGCQCARASAVSVAGRRCIAGRPRSRMRVMDLSYTPEEEAFRARVRAWLEENARRRARWPRTSRRCAPGSASCTTAASSASAGRRSTAAPASPRWSRRSSTRSWRARARRGVDQRDGDLVGRSGDHEVRHRGAEAALHPEDPHLRGDLGDRLLRAVVGLRHGGREDARRARRRLLRRQRPEDLDHARAHLGLVLRPGPHLDRRSEVGRPDAAADGHARARASRSSRSGRSTATPSSTRSS